HCGDAVTTYDLEEAGTVVKLGAADFVHHRFQPGALHGIMVTFAALPEIAAHGVAIDEQDAAMPMFDKVPNRQTHCFGVIEHDDRDPGRRLVGKTGHGRDTMLH